MRSARPCLLAVQNPFTVALLGARPQAGEVAARVGFAEPLAEDQLAVEDLVDVSLLLPRRSVYEERGGEQAHTEAPEDDRRTGLRHLLLVDRLNDGRGGAAPCLERPRQLQPPSVVKPALPLPLEVGLILLAEASDAATPPLGREVEIEPGSDLLPEGLFFSCEAEIHDQIMRRARGAGGAT